MRADAGPPAADHERRALQAAPRDPAEHRPVMVALNDNAALSRSPVPGWPAAAYLCKAANFAGSGPRSFAAKPWRSLALPISRAASDD